MGENVRAKVCVRVRVLNHMCGRGVCVRVRVYEYVIAQNYFLSDIHR